MAKQGISTGGLSGIGADTLFEGALKINSNFDEIYSTFGDGTTLNPSLGGGVVGSAGTWSVNASGIHTSKNVGIGTELSTSALTVEGDGRFSGVVTANSFVGNGSSLTGISTFSGDYNDLTNTPTNLSVFSNDVGFITSYTETSTLNDILVRDNTSGIGMSVGVVTATRFESTSAGTPTLDSPNNLNINAVTVAISTDLTVGGDVSIGNNLTVTGVVTASSFSGSVSYASSAGVSTNINITGTNPTDSSTYLLISQNLATGSQAVYTKNSLLFDSSANILYASTGGTHSGTVNNNLTKTKTFITKDDLDNDISYTSAYKGSSSGIGSTSISLVGTSGTLPLSFEMIISINPTNLGLGVANDMQITKLLGVFDGDTTVSFTGYSTSFVNSPSSLATFDIDNAGDSNSLRLIINPTGVGNTTEYQYKVHMTYFFPY